MVLFQYVSTIFSVSALSIQKVDKFFQFILAFFLLCWYNINLLQANYAYMRIADTLIVIGGGVWFAEY